MDKTAQAARQARLAQALRTNLRRRKAGDAPRPAPDPASSAPEVEPTSPSRASRDDSAT